MSYHSSSTWGFTEEVTDKVVKETINGVLGNKTYFSHEHPEEPWMGCYMISSCMDAFLHNIGSALNKQLDLFDDEVMTKWVSEAPEEARDNIRNLATQVLDALVNSGDLQKPEEAP